MSDKRVIPMKGQEASGKTLLQELKEWSSCPFLEHTKVCGFTIPLTISRFFLSNKIEYAHDLALIGKYGFAEGVAAKLNTFVLLDKNHDGNIGLEEQVEATNDDISGLIDGYLSLFQNIGVIAALIISVIFPLTLAAGSTISPDTIDFFGLTCSKVFYYIYLILVNAIVLTSLFMIFMAIHLYKHLSFWMATPKARLTWTRVVNNHVVSFIIRGSTIMMMLATTIPFGAVSLGGPIPGLISLIFLALFFLCLSEFTVSEEEALRILYHEVQSVISRY